MTFTSMKLTCPSSSKSCLSSLFALLPLLMAGLFFGPAIKPSTAQERPNIIMILADDLGNSDVSAYNPLATPLINTPSIDQLAASGIRFTDGRTPDGVCTPTRYGLLTGRYSWRTRLKENVLRGYNRPLISSDRTTVASMLQGKGYNTHAVGKWHLGLDWSDADGNATTNPTEKDADRVDFTRPLLSGPADVGFDTSVLYPASLNMAPFVYIRNHQTSLADGTPITNQSTQMKYTSEFKEEFGSNVHTGWAVNDFKVPGLQPTIARESVAYINQQATDGGDAPFFLYVPFTGPHKPVAPSGNFPNANPKANSNDSPYGEFMADIDESVRLIVAAVDAQGQEFADNTLIIFSADNGAHQIAFGPNNQHIANAPYRDKKLSAYDGGVRVPFIVRWGSKVAPRQVIDQRVGLIDLFGTVAEIVGHEIQDGEAEDTASFAHILLNADKTPIREAHLYHSYKGSFAIGSDEWKLFTDAKGGAEAADPDLSSWQLYNLDEDVDESDNLVNLHLNKAVELGLMIDRYKPNAKTGRSRTHRKMLVRFDMIDFQAGSAGSPSNPKVNELTATNRLATGVTVLQGLKKGSGISYDVQQNRATVTTPETLGNAVNHGDEFHVNGFEAHSLEDAKNNGDYLSYVLEVNEGQTAKDLLISFDLWRDGTDSATHYTLLTSVDDFTTPISALVFGQNEFGINLGSDFSGGEYGVGSAKTLSGLLESPDWSNNGQLEIRIYGYSAGQSLSGSTHVISARVEGTVDTHADDETTGVTITSG